MQDSLACIVLWLFVINLGIAFGAGLYETRIAVPQWLSYIPGSGYRWNAAAAAEANVGLRFWVYVTTIPLTLLTLVSLVGALSARQPVRTWWLVAVAAALIDRLLTFTYFIPTMIKLTRGDIRPEFAAVAKARQLGETGVCASRRHTGRLPGSASGLCLDESVPDRVMAPTLRSRRPPRRSAPAAPAPLRP
jgi:hypothetical protein